MRFRSKWSRRFLAGLCLVALSATGSAAAHGQSVASKSSFRQPDPKAHPDLFVWTDTCNVYVLRDGDAALLIDFGDGSVVDHLVDIGVKHVEWVLLTHHHREQCQGIERVDRARTRVAAPSAAGVGGQFEGGRYTISAAEGPLPGRYRVEIRAPERTGKKVRHPLDPKDTVDEVLDTIPNKYNSASTLERDVKAGKNVLDFELSKK